ncbi:MAG: FlgO family outer membrane protein [Desulfurivibrio sp.]
MPVDDWLKNILWPLLVGALLLSAGLGGCADKPRATLSGAGVTVSVITPDFFGIGEDLAVQLVGNFRSGGEVPGTRLILTSLVDLDNLRESSRFGRTVSEALATQLFRHGFEVEEVRKAEAIMIRDPTGELVLSRDISRLAREHAAHAVVAGTYSLTPGTVIVNVRLLDAASRSVLSVAGIEIQRSRAINNMLAASSGSGLSDTGLSGYER